MVVPLKLIFVVSVILPVAISLRPLREREIGSLGGLSSSTPWPDEVGFRFLFVPILPVPSIVDSVLDFQKVWFFMCFVFVICFCL